MTKQRTAARNEIITLAGLLGNQHPVLNRWRHLTSLLVVWMALACVCPQPLSAVEPTWKAGTASAKITPDKRLWLAGFGSRDHPAEGTLHDLWVKVLALETADGNRAVVLTTDLLGFPKSMYDALCLKLKSQCSLDASQIMLTASHTHSGPVLRGALYDVYPLDDAQKCLIEEYSLALEKLIVDAVAEACAKLEPATLWAGEGSADFAVNRRNNPQAEVRELRAQGVALNGPVDHAVPVLAVRGVDNRLRAMVFGYACHPTTLDFYRWSGDFPGFAQIALEQDFPGAMAMFFAGCGADQNPLPRGSVALCGKYGFTLADAVEEVLRKPMRPIPPRLATALEIVDLPFEKTLSRKDLQAGLAKNIYYRRRSRRLLNQLDAGRSFAASYPYPVQVWQLGDGQLWIALGGEVVVDYALRCKAKYGPQTWVTGYCNDVMAYIPSHRVWQEEGYEAGAFYVYGLPTDRWAMGLEERIAASIDRMVEKLDD